VSGREPDGKVRTNLFAAIGRFAYRRRWLVVAVWLVLFAGGITLTPELSHVLKGSGFSASNSPSAQAAALIKQRLGQGSNSLVVVLRGQGASAKSAAFQKQEAKILVALKTAGIPGLQSIQSYASTGADQLLAKDGKSSVAVLTFATAAPAVQQQTAAIRAALKRGAESTQLTPYLTGEPAVNADLTKASLSDLRRVEVFALPLALIALVLVFGTVVAAALPVITGGMAVSVTLGGVYLLGTVTSMSIFVMNVATLLGLAVAIDYALFIVARFREELHASDTVEGAVESTISSAGRSVFYSGIAVVVGLIGLTFFPAPGMRSIGIGGALVVFLSVAASLTFMPALLGLLGKRVDAWRVVPLRPPHESRFWTGWARIVLRRPWAALIVSVALAVFFASPVVGLKERMTSPASLPASSESRVGADILASEFDQRALSPLSVLVTWRGQGPIDLAKATQLYSVGQTLAKTPGVASVISPVNLQGLDNPVVLAALWPTLQTFVNDPASIPDRAIKLGSATISRSQMAQIKQLLLTSVGKGAVLFRVMTKAPPTSSQARDLVGVLRKIKAPSGMTVSIAGQAANDRDVLHDLNSRLPWIAIWIVVSSYVVLFLLLRSVLLPLLAIAVNWLTILMSWGVLAFIFQRNTFAGLLQFTNTGSVDAMIPIIILCLLFGVTMDYAVFLLTRMREEWHQSGDNRASVEHGLVRSGRVVVSAAVLVVIVVGSFAFTSVSATKVLGVGIALAVIFDTVLIRMSTLPAAMCYLGRANWWSPRAHTDGMSADESQGFSRKAGAPVGRVDE
jgi:RND superfamily putative drug exporter